MSIFKQYGVDAHADLPYGLGWNAFTDFTHDCQVRPTHGEWWLCAPPAVAWVLTKISVAHVQIPDSRCELKDTDTIFISTSRNCRWRHTGVTHSTFL